MKYLSLKRDISPLTARPRVTFAYEDEDGVVTVLITYTKDYPVEEGYPVEGKGTLEEWDVAIKVSGDQTAGNHQLLRHAGYVSEAVAHHYAAGHPALVLEGQ